MKTQLKCKDNSGRKKLQKEPPYILTQKHAICITAIYTTELKPHQFGCGCSAGSVQTDVHERVFLWEMKEAGTSLPAACQTARGFRPSPHVRRVLNRSRCPRAKHSEAADAEGGASTSASAHLRLPTQQEWPPQLRLPPTFHFHFCCMGSSAT